MKYEQINNNRVVVAGEVVAKPIFSHETFGEAFYEIQLSVLRLSEKADIIPVVISEKLLADKRFGVGKTICIKGQFRSYNKTENDHSRLVLTVFAREIVEPNSEVNPNIIEIIGFICKPPIYRTTPFKREICDLLVAVNRSYNKSDYLPCIAWGRNARYLKEVEVGTKIFLVGRIQSREYVKKHEDGTQETKIAYEISVSRVQIENEEPQVVEEYEDDDAINL
ncbi:MAG: single-stranded DNA-binding protein [Christensenellales bacterium]|jgi:primosomal replication protein N